MQMHIMVPPHLRSHWILVVARNLSVKYPEIIVVGPVDSRLDTQLRRFHVPIIDPPEIPAKPKSLWGRLWWWWSTRKIRRWDPLDECDEVLLLVDKSPYTADAIQMARSRGIRMHMVKVPE
jgi:DNA-binding transcriptional LysR family regulator